MSFLSIVHQFQALSGHFNSSCCPNFSFNLLITHNFPSTLESDILQICLKTVVFIYLRAFHLVLSVNSPCPGNLTAFKTFFFYPTRSYFICRIQTAKSKKLLLEFYLCKPFFLWPLLCWHNCLRCTYVNCPFKHNIVFCVLQLFSFVLFFGSFSLSQFTLLSFFSVPFSSVKSNNSKKKRSQRNN